MFKKNRESIKVKRNLPVTKSTHKKLEKSLKPEHIRFLYSGEVVTYTEDPGFMAMFYFISVYKPGEDFFGSPRLELARRLEIDDSRDLAVEVWDKLTSSRHAVSEDISGIGSNSWIKDSLDG